MTVRFFWTNCLLYDFFLRGGGEVCVFLSKKEISPVWSILTCSRIGCIQSEVACNYMCLCLCNTNYTAVHSHKHRITLLINFFNFKYNLDEPSSRPEYVNEVRIFRPLSNIEP
jgi:hypothetical protein